MAGAIKGRRRRRYMWSANVPAAPFKGAMESISSVDMAAGVLSCMASSFWRTMVTFVLSGWVFAARETNRAGSIGVIWAWLICSRL